MKKTDVRYQRSFLLSSAILLSISSTGVFAGNTAVNGVATRAETMQAFTAVADDPAAIYYNPAGLTQIHGTDIESEVTYIRPDLQYYNTVTNYNTHSPETVLGPNLFVSTDKVPHVTLGVGVYAPFARLTDYDLNLATFNLPQSAKFLRMDFVPAIAVDLGRYVSVGAGVVGSRVVISSDVLGFDENGVGYGVSGQGGILIKPLSNVKIGVSYRGPEDTRVNGSGLLVAPGMTINDDFGADVKFPGTLSTGIAWQALTQLLLTADYDDEMWSYVDEVKREYNNPVLNKIAVSPINGKNSNDYRVGMEYRPFTHDAFRAGYSYNQAAVPAVNIIPAQPDYNVNYFSLGYSHYFKKVRLDGGYEYATSPTRDSNSPVFPGQYRVHANLFLLGLSYVFGNQQTVT